MKKLWRIIKKMTRDEAIKCVEFHADELEKRGYEDIHVRQALERLKEPMTLADFLGWEEGVEYTNSGYKFFKIKNNELFEKLEMDRDWAFSSIELNNIENLKRAKKVLPKKKAYRVKDEYSLECLVQELQDQGFEYKTLTLEEYMKMKKDSLKRDGVTYLYVDEVNGIDGFNKGYTSIDEFEIVDYHKEKPKYYAKIKGWYLLEKENYYYRWHRELKRITLGTKVRTIANENRLDHYLTKSEWNKLGIDDSNAAFEEVEE